MSALAAWRFWLTMTKVERKMASRLTTIVRRPKGNLSNTSAPPTSPTLARIHSPNQTVWR